MNSNSTDRTNGPRPVNITPSNTPHPTTHSNTHHPASSFNTNTNLPTGIQSWVLQLIQQLLTVLQQVEPPQPDKYLSLSPEQQNQIKTLLGFNAATPFSVDVLDKDRSGQISQGDTVIVRGGITGGEIMRRTLTANDIKALNEPPPLPEALLTNEAKWQQTSADPTSQISYTLQQSCFCPRDYTRPMNLTELNGRITKATYADTGEAVPEYIRDGLLTMQERFDQLKDAYASEADRIDVTYDPHLGFPSSVYIDRSYSMADEEISYTIQNLSKT